NEMQKTWQFKYRHFLTPPEVRTKVVRSFLNHLVHHRAQLGMYLRLNGIPVPGMYGPSADESF
ncbi:MAG TPA: DinB family protein, partial [Verrucomicrobiaceae bacterium]